MRHEDTLKVFPLGFRNTYIRDTCDDQLEVIHNAWAPRLTLTVLNERGESAPSGTPIELDRDGVQQLAEELIHFLRSHAHEA